MVITHLRRVDRHDRATRPRKCAGWLVILLAFLVACSNSPAPNPAATQTRAAEQAELTAVAGTVAPLPGRPQATPGTPTGARQTPQRTLTPTPARRSPTKAGIPALTDMIVDEARGRLYGSDQKGGKVIVLGLPDLETIASIDVGQAAQPVGLALDPAGGELAVALFGAGNIALIDTASLQVVGKLLPGSQRTGQPRPWSVIYVQPGRLYSAGSMDEHAPLYVFDTATRSQVGSTRDSFYGPAQLALSDDGSLFISVSSVSPQQIYRYAVGDPAPVQVARGPHGPVEVSGLAVRNDGAAVYTARGQVWSSNLQSQLGAFAADGSSVEYTAATERLFISDERGIVEVEATGNYNLIATYATSAPARVARATSDGKIVYVSTDAGIEVIQPGASPTALPIASPTPRQTVPRMPTHSRPVSDPDPTATTARTTPVGPRVTPAKPGVPAFTDLIVDDARSRLYGTDKLAGRVVVLGLPNLETVASIDVGQTAQPVGLSLSPDGTELAVALFGAGNIALIDPTSLQAAGKLIPTPQRGDTATPWSVVFTKPGRLFAAGGGNHEMIYVFDTPSRSQIGVSKYPDFAGPQSKMVAADDGSLYASDNRGGSPENIVRFSPDETTPKQVARGPHGPVEVPDLAVRRDGTAVYTAGGQVWSSNLQSRLGAIAAVGTCITYVPATERLYICQEKGVAEVEATGNYNLVATYATSAPARVARASGDGKTVYVSTDAGMEVIKPGVSTQVPPSTSPGPSAAPQPRTSPTATTGTGFTPTKPGVPALFELALDEDRNRLYGTDRAAGKLLVFELPALSQIAAIDLGTVSQPAGVALSPDGTEIAVALSGAGHIALIDPASLTIAGKLYPTGVTGPGLPWDVRFSPSGYLFSTGGSGSSGLDHIHVFDTKTRTEIGRSTDIVRDTPRLAFSADGSIFVAEQDSLYRYALEGNVPVQKSHSPFSSISAPDLAVRPDGTAVYTSGGQVWSGDLKSRLGTFNAQGTRIEYVPFTERLYICQESAIVEVEATGNYNVVKTHGVGTPARAARANAHGTMLYVSTDAGIVVIPLGATPSPSPKP